MLPFGRAGPAAPAPLFQSSFRLAGDGDTDTESEAPRDALPAQSAFPDAHADARADADDGDLLDPFLDNAHAPPAQPLPLSVEPTVPPPHAQSARVAVGMPTHDPALSSPFLDAPRPSSPRTRAAQDAHRFTLRLQRDRPAAHHPHEGDESFVPYSDDDNDGDHDESEHTTSPEAPGRTRHFASNRSSERLPGEIGGSLYDSTPSGSFGGGARWGNPLRMHKALEGRSYLAPPRPPTSLSTSSAFLQQDVYDEQIFGLQPSVALAVPTSSRDKGKGSQRKPSSSHPPQESDAEASDESGTTETALPRPSGKRRTDSGPRALFSASPQPRGAGRGAAGEESIPMLRSTTGSVLGGKGASHPHGTRSNGGRAHPDASRHLPVPLLGQDVSPAAATWARERHDLWALALFLLYVLPVMFLSVLAAWEAPTLPFVPGLGGDMEPLHDTLLRTAPLLALTSVVAGVMGISLLSLLQRLARAQNRTRGSRKFNVVLNLLRSISAAIPFALAAASIALLGGSFSPSTHFSWLLPAFAAVCAVASARTGVKVWRERKKLPQASRAAILAAHVLGSHPSLVLVAVLTSAALIALALFCLVLLTRLAAIAAVRAVPLPGRDVGKGRGKGKGTGHNKEPQSGSDPIGLAPLPLSLALLLAWGWATSTGLNALKLITSAAVSHWYFYRSSDLNSDPAQQAPQHASSDTEESLTGSSSGMSATGPGDPAAPALARADEDQIVSQGIRRALGPALGSVMAASLLRTALALVRGLVLVARTVVHSVSWLHHLALARTAAIAGQAVLPDPAAASVVLGSGVLAGALGWVARILDPLAYVASLIVGIEAVVEEHASNAILYTGITGAPLSVASRRAAALRSASVSVTATATDPAGTTADGHHYHRHRRVPPPEHGARVLRRLGRGLTWGVAALVAALGASYVSVVRDEPGAHALVTAAVCAVPPLLVGTALTSILTDTSDTLVLCYLMDRAAGTQHCPPVEEAVRLPQPDASRVVHVHTHGRVAQQHAARQR